jgi:hypothetical protein
MSSLKSTLPSSSYVDTYNPRNKNNNNQGIYSSEPHLTSFGDSNNVGNQMSSTTFQRTSFSIGKPTGFNQTREKERFELSTLNDKFADYVEKVRYLEAQNKKIQVDTSFLNGKQQEGCQKLKTMFETEIAQLKETAEKLFKHKNTIFISSQGVQVNSYKIYF